MVKIGNKLVGYSTAEGLLPVEKDPRSHWPEDLQEWMVVSLDEEDQPKMVWKRGAASYVLVLNVEEHIRVLSWDGPGVGLLEHMDESVENQFTEYPYAPKGLHIFEGTLAGDWEDGVVLEGEFRKLTEAEWDRFDEGYSDEVWRDNNWPDSETRAVPYLVWLDYPIHKAGSRLGSGCGQLPGWPKNWPDGHRSTYKFQNVTCEACRNNCSLQDALADDLWV